MKKEKTPAPGLSPMRQMAMDLVESEGVVAPYSLKNKWCEVKNKPYHAASRDDFGLTTNAYRSLRFLEAKGLIKRKNPGSRHDDTYVKA